MGAISGINEKRSTPDHPVFKHASVLFLEYCSGGSLSAFLRSRLDHEQHRGSGRHEKYGRLSESEALWVAECAGRALVYLKEKRIIHRDIKVGNLLLQSAVEPGRDILKTGIVLCDFGLSKQLAPGETHSKGSSGTPSHVSPEVYLEDRATFAADVWALGVTLFTCLNGRSPFHESDSSYMRYKIVHAEYKWSSATKKCLSPNVRNLVDDLIERNVEHRLTAEGLLGRLAAMRDAQPSISARK